MLNTTIVKIKIGRNTKKEYYESLGYNINVDYMFVDIKDIPRGSHLLIDAKCDYCESIKNVTYKEYNRNISFNGKFSCSNKCGSIKKKELSIIKYGVDSPSKLEHIKKKNIKTNLEKYGVIHLNQLEEKKIKIKETNLEKYGVENVMLVECFKEKLKNTNLERYDVENVFQSKMIKDRIKENNIERYGVEYYSSTSEYREKYKNTNLEKYGVEYPLQCSIFKNKMRNTNEINGVWIKLDDMNDFKIYKKLVIKLTRSNVKNMPWDGTDFYDNEYIKDNFSLYYLNNNYPTIDHKISIFNGFNQNKSVEEISDISNLCWTKRIINITKNRY